MGTAVPPPPDLLADEEGALVEHGLPERAPVAQLRALARVAAAMCRVSTAVVNLLDGCYQHQVGEVGFTGSRTSSSASMCALAMRQPRLRYVPDASVEPAFAANPWVDGRLADVRFYASAPLVLADGRALGSLCVFSDRPTTLDDAQRTALTDLAAQAVFLVEQASGAREATRRATLFEQLARRSAEAERRLAEVAAQARSTVDTCADAFVSVDEDGAVLDWNRAAEAVFGWSHEQALGRDLAELLVPPGLRPAHRSGLARLRAGGDARVLGRQLQVSALHRDGHALPVELTIWRTRADGGWRYNAFLRDVTEREQAQAALAAARDDAERRAALTSAVLETIDVGVVACDADGHLTLFNRAARDLHGSAEDPAVASEDWAGRYSLYAEDGTTLLQRHEVPLVRALTDGALQDTTMVVAPSGAAARTVRCDGRAMRDGDGRLLGAVVAMKDVSDARARAAELMQARDQALAATRAKTAFLAAASHEIRTPLNGVLGTLELLSLQDLTAEQAGYVTVAHESGRALLRLLNDVLDLSKAETTTVVLADEPVRPLAVARDVVAALEPVAARKGLALRLVAGRDRLVRGDASRLRQVLMNLVGNAVKFTAEGAVTVTVDTGPRADGRAELRLSVTDTGAGMPPEELGRLFEPFVQGTQGQRYGGTGLGLALTQQIVDLMGGHVEVTSAPGRGSTFAVVVALPDAPDDVTPAPAGTAAVGSGPSPVRVLVADDNDTNLLVAEAMLAVLGVEVVTVHDGDEAVEAVRTQPFDLVLLDNRMPRLSGPDAAQAIRALPGPAASTRLVALTASVTDDDRVRFAASGLDEILVKPIQLADLQRALEQA